MTAQSTAKTDAMQVYQDLLDTLSDAIVSRDLAAMRARTHLPFVHRTLDAETTVVSEDELDDGTVGFAQALAARGVNQFIRLAKDAEFVEPGRIRGHHVTHMLCDAKRVMPSYTSQVVLQNEADVWKLAEMSSPLTNSGWPLKLLSVPDSPLDVLGQQDLASTASHTATEPLALYQSFLDKLDDANNRNDPSAFGALCNVQFTSHHDDMDLVMHGHEDIEGFFDLVKRTFEDSGAERLKREAHRADFINDTTICGYHFVHLYRGQQVVADPIFSRMILEKTGAVWRMKSVSNAPFIPNCTVSDPLRHEKSAAIREH